ncbi:MAG: RNA polymerase sigma-I factor [Clostridiales bacterium]
MFSIESIINWKDKKNKIEYEIHRIKNGDNVARNQFILKYKPFIAKVVSKVMKRYIDINNSDEFCVGLFAFNSAIDSYNSSRGSFIRYAEIVIRSRVIDYLRKSNNNEIPFTDLENSEKMNFLFNRKDLKATMSFDNFESEEDIKLFSKDLSKFKITFKELISATPKHRDSIRNCIKVSIIIIKNYELYELLMSKRNLPMKRLMKYTNLHKRTIERNRKFIIAIVLLLKSDLDIIKSYLYYTESAGDKKL